MWKKPILIFIALIFLCSACDYNESNETFSKIPGDTYTSPGGRIKIVLSYDSFGEYQDIYRDHGEAIEIFIESIEKKYEVITPGNQLPRAENGAMTKENKD